MKVAVCIALCALVFASCVSAQNCNVNTCTFASSVVPTGAITFSTSGGYTPKCLRVDIGGTITFQGDFIDHPLAGGVVANLRVTPSGSDSPFVPTRTGTFPSVTIAFRTAGVFPYYCTDHLNMVGVVYVGQNSTSCVPPPPSTNSPASSLIVSLAVVVLSSIAAMLAL